MYDLPTEKYWGARAPSAPPAVRSLSDIDGLPFNTEGYERAKNILKTEYGSTSEIVNAYISNILKLPVVNGTDPKVIEDFYKKLLYNVQSLETMGRLRDVAGNVRTVLDKLKGIKADLVRGKKAGKTGILQSWYKLSNVGRTLTLAWRERVHLVTNMIGMQVTVAGSLSQNATRQTKSKRLCLL